MHLKQKILGSALSSLVMTSSVAMAPVSADRSVTNSPVKHTVVIFQENRTFDNYWGTYPYAPGFHAISGTPQDVVNFKHVSDNVVKDVSGNVYNPDDNGNPVYPWHDTGKAKIQQPDVNHGYADMIAMVDGGKMDKFYTMNSKGTNPTRGKLSMSYFDYNEIPAYWQYAQHYALADNYFQPVSGPSTPGAFYLIAAQSGNGSDPANNNVPSSQITSDPSPKNGPFGGDNPKGLTYNLTYKNIGDELTANNQSWAWYAGGWDAAKANPGSPEALKYSPHHNPFQYFQNYEDGKYIQNLKDYTHFSQDVANGTLPTVSFIKGGYGDDEHPGLGNQSTPSAEDFTVKTINQIMNSPYWKDTAIIVTYDEGGGFYDHVAPPEAVKTADGLIGNSTRVPALVISPYSKQNYVSHVQYDHTSILKFLEWNYNLPALNNRDKNANNLLDMFDFKHPNAKPYVYQLGAAVDPKSDYYHNINGEIDLNGAKKEDTTITLINNADRTVQTAKYGQTLASQYGDFGLTALETANGKLQYHFQVPSGTFIVKVRSGNNTSSATITTNSVNTMTYNGVTFYNDKSDHKLVRGSNGNNDNNEDSNENVNDVDDGSK
ncbi:alkaline phosphatase family protein [Paenibacillus sp. GP183]|uniref:phospholipase C n=1 Tax=Paenibacillus sp. GP183 TaxID=1882751 RepID=UPI000896BFBE|nr:alkaline phosphatase family protein [Paenibacillus sp. GP183]SEB82397.1 phospholipase C [Paenibacillus sp. GP183]